MVAADPPCPDIFRGAAEDAEPVQLGVTSLVPRSAGPALEGAQHPLERHDLARGLRAPRGEPGSEQSYGVLALVRLHGSDRQPVPRTGGVLPAVALVIGEVVRR